MTNSPMISPLSDLELDAVTGGRGGDGVRIRVRVRDGESRLDLRVKDDELRLRVRDGESRLDLRVEAAETQPG
jgi:hypothetical protein